MKRVLMTVFILIPLCVMGKVKVNGLWFELVPKAGIASVVASQDGAYAGDVVIPSAIDYDGTTYRVTAVADNAFMDSQIMSLKLSDELTDIGEFAFYGCENLTEVSLGVHLKSVGYRAFANCKNLEKIELAVEDMSLQEVFIDCNSLKEVHSTSIGQWCSLQFKENNPLTTAHHLYIDGQEVTDVTLPTDLNKLSDMAFMGCTSIQSLTLPASACQWGMSCFESCTNLEKVVIPEGPTTLGGRMFANCSSLTSVSLPNSMEDIGGMAFYHCENLSLVSFGNQLRGIHQGAFSECQKLASVAFPESLYEIGVNAFANCTSLTAVNLPHLVERVETGAFSGCSSLKEVVLGEKTKLAANAFGDCVNIENVYAYQSKSKFTNERVADVAAFAGSYVDYATLHVAEECIDFCKANQPWSSFGTIVPLSEGTGVRDTSGEVRDVPVELYDTSGRRVDASLPKGQVVIVVQGNKVTKLTINN